MRCTAACTQRALILTVITSRGCDALVFPWLQAWFTHGSYITLTTATIKLELSLLLLRVKWSFLVLLSCWRFTRGTTPVSAYVNFGLCLLCLCVVDTICWLLDFLKLGLPTLFSFLSHTLWLAVHNTVQNFDNFTHVLQQSDWRSPMSLVVWYKYLICAEDVGCGRGWQDETEPFERSHYHWLSVYADIHISNHGTLR